MKHAHVRCRHRKGDRHPLTRGRLDVGRAYLSRDSRLCAVSMLQVRVKSGSFGLPAVLASLLACLLARLPACLPTSLLPACLRASVPDCLPACLTACLRARLTYLPACLTYLPTYLPTCESAPHAHLFLDRRPKDCLRVSRDRECLHLLREHHLILLTRSREARSQFPVVHSAGLWFPLIAKSVATMDPLCRPVYNTSKPAKMFCMKFASSLSETFSVDQKNNFARYRIPARMFY